MTNRHREALLTAGISPLLSFALLLSGSALVFTGAAISDPPNNGGCPAGFEYISVAEAEAGMPPQYDVPALTDAAGNNDGYVCRRALGDGLFNTVPSPADTVYLWLDNSEPQGG